MPQFNKKEYKNFSDVIDYCSNNRTIFDEKIKSIKFRESLLNDANKYIEKDLEFLKRLWSHSKGVITIKQGDAYFSEDEFKQFKDKLHALTVKIKDDDSRENYIDCLEEIENWRGYGKKRIRKVYRVCLRRAFLTFHPKKFINWGTDKGIKEILKILSSFDDVNKLLNGFNYKSDWHTMSSELNSVISKINNKRLNSDCLRWLIYILYEQNKNIDKKLKDNSNYISLDYESAKAEEGYKVDKKFLVSKRNKIIVERRKAKDNYRCQACFRKNQVNGKFVIDCHHINPISLGKRETKIDDLISLCPTCHRIAHLRIPPYDLNELKVIAEEAEKVVTEY